MAVEVKLSNVSKHFQSRDKHKAEKVVAVDHFDLTIPDGELVGLLGPSGCGKSTLLYMISGLEEPSEGQIFFGDEDVTALPTQKRGVGFVFQNYALYPHMTVLQNILFPLQNSAKKEKLSKAEMMKKATEAARVVEMEEYLSRKPHQLSGGQQQRVAIARALVRNPKVLLLDEPLSNLDARLRLQTREELRTIQRLTGITTVFVTHDQEEAMSICDRIAVIQKGTLMQSGSPQAIYDSPDHLFTAQFLGTPPINLFDASIKNQTLFIGTAPVLPTPGLQDEEQLTVGIRPEGFAVSENGVLSCRLKEIQMMGRDTCLLLTANGAQKEFFRCIVDGLVARNGLPEQLKLSIKPEKLFIFRNSTGERVRLL